MRAIRTTLIVAVVLAGLFVAADRVAVYFAENKAAEKIRSSQNLSGTPEVSIKGFPFLTQVANSSLDEVEVKLKEGVTASAGGQSVRVSRFDATLNDVAFDSSFTSATARKATGTAHLSYADLTKAAGDPAVSVGYGGAGGDGKGGQGAAGDNKVKVTGKVSFLGQTVEPSVVSSVSVVNGDTIRLRAEEIPAQGLPGVEHKIRSKIDFDRKITGLPRGITVTKVAATPDGVDITLGGDNVRLAGGGN
ncbi:DUF2993 domain-containing protein [Streptomyces gamaensis]|uniref:DUF2993 domain-containing protein n=1 Tax=Streptomyces gamaensis TaxID=1763542 RepID=A0ABW0Z4B0_9ACTN